MPVVAIPLIVVFAVALIALVLYYALEALVTGISYVLPTFSIPGLGSIRNFALGAIHGALGVVQNYILPSLAVVVQFINAPVVLLSEFFSKIGALAGEAYSSILWIKTTLVPRVTTALQAYAANLYNQAIAYTNGAISVVNNAIAAAESYAVNHANQLYNAIYATAAQWVANAIAHADAAVSAVQHEAQQLYNQSIAYTVSQVAGVESDIATGIAATRQYAAAIGSQVESDARTLAGHAEQVGIAAASAAGAAAVAAVTGPLITDLPGLWSAVNAGADAITDAAGDAFSDVQDLVRGIPRAVPISAGATIAATIPMVAALSKLAADCVIPNCKNLSGFGRDIQALFGLVEDAAFLALIAEFITNPQSAAEEAMTVIVPVVDGARSVAEHLLGV